MIHYNCIYFVRHRRYINIQHKPITSDGTRRDRQTGIKTK